jgi:dihydropyrimidinase
MQEFDVILRNACVNGSHLCDIGIKHGLITAMGLGLVATEDTEIVDCEDAVVTPGGVDAHVHLSQDRSPRAFEAGYVSADTGNYILILIYIS